MGGEQPRREIAAGLAQPDTASIGTVRDATPETRVESYQPQTAHDLPHVFGRYRVIRKLGAGGMGAVYLAHDTHLDGPVALKVPAGSESGKLLRVKGRGAPKLNGGGKGDLLARLVVTVPKKLSKAEKEALEAYRSASREQPREHLARVT